MITINLRGQEEKYWTGESPDPKTLPHDLLYHQWRTYHAEEPIIVNTTNTGMGKTKAALLRMLKRAQQSQRLVPTKDNVLFIAPTNELIMQHAVDAERFCQDNGLPYRVLPLMKETQERFIANYRAAHPSLPSTRPAHDLLTLLRESSKIDADLSKTVSLWVVNPDIFHYATTFGYNPFDRSQLFNAFFNLFNYLIVDEFHYYDAKQLATFLFFLKYSQYQEYIGSKATQRQFCILTATLSTAVRRYLEGLGEPIAWIEPGYVAPEDREYVKPVCALAPLRLQVYSTEELQAQEQGGELLQLVMRESDTLRQCVGKTRDDGEGAEPIEGAIISHAKGTISLIKQALLRSGISPQMIGCITGADKPESRHEAKEKALILATPTVDIGYNFERSYLKKRQNIDFVFFDADFRDEFLQRIGRAGRVLGKEQKDQKSNVYAVVSPACYELLRKFDQATLERWQLSELLKAETFPNKNDLSAYLRTGGIIGLYPAFVTLCQGMSESEQETFLNSFVTDLSHLFVGKTSASVKVPTYKEMKKVVFRYEQQQKHYGKLGSIPPQAFEWLPDLLKKKLTAQEAEEADSGVKEPLEAFVQRIKDARQSLPSKQLSEVIDWFHEDLRQYVIENARRSFREGFQPPQALVYDPKELHSSEEVARYNALHFVRYYNLLSYPSLEDWKAETKKDGAEASAYFWLLDLREEPLQLVFKMDKRDERRAHWEEKNAYRLVALHGLEIFPAKKNHGLAREIQVLFQQQLILAFVARNDPTCATWKVLQRLQKRARLYPMLLSVAFDDVPAQEYLAILGTMAFHVCAEIPFWARASDLGKAQIEDETPLIY